MRLLLLVLAVGSLIGFSPKKHRVEQIGKKFSKSEIHIALGDSILFVNNDVVMHNVFSSTPDFKFNLRKQPPRTARAVSFSRRGTTQVRCAFHPTMRLTVVIE